MLKITAICFLFLNGFIVRFDGVVKCAPAAAVVGSSGAGPARAATTSSSKPRHYDPNHGFEPYWPGGEWVFYGDPGKPTTEAPAEVCGDECHYLYQEVGKVCGRYIDNLYYTGCRTRWNQWCYGTEHNDYSQGYQTFDSYCEFMDIACKSADKTKPAFNRWIFVHRGPCIDDHNATYYKPMYRPEDPASRLAFYMSSVNKTFVQLGRKPC